MDTKSWTVLAVNLFTDRLVVIDVDFYLNSAGGNNIIILCAPILDTKYKMPGWSVNVSYFRL